MRRARNPAPARIYIRLWYLYISSMLIPLVILAGILVSYFDVRLLEDKSQQIANTLGTVSYNIETLLNEMQQCTLAWVNSSELSEFYKRVSLNQGEIPLRPVQLESECTVACHNILATSNSRICGIGFLPLDNPRANFYIVMRYWDIDAFAGYATDAPWYRETVDARGSAVFCPPSEEPYYSDATPGTYFAVTRLVSDLNTRKPYGIIKVDASCEYLVNLFSMLELGDESGIVLMDDGGNIIYSTNASLNPLISFANEDGPRVTSARGDYNVHVQPVNGSTWMLVYLASDGDMAASTRPIVMFAVLVGLTAVAASLLIFRRNSARIAAPVENILVTMRATESGDLGTRIPVDARATDDFSRIARECNHMLDMLNRHIDSEYKARISQQTAEFAALQTQINPHFFYNTLNGLITLNRIGAKRELEDSIIRLTQLFRYTSGNGHETTVRKEIEFVRQYLALQQLRFGDRLSFETTMQDETADYVIPKLLLQPLVENAVVHGLEPIERCVHIDVCAEIVDKSGQPFLRLSVSDDGAGVDVREFTDEQSTAASGHIGLQNVRERLRLCATDAEFAFSGKPDRGAASVMLIPLNRLRKSAVREDN